MNHECPGCGAPFDIKSMESIIECKFCGTQIVHQPQVVEAEIIEPAPAAAPAAPPPPDNSGIQREQILQEIAEQKQLVDRLKTWIVPIALGTIMPGFFGGFIGCIFLSNAKKTWAAILCGIGCGALAIFGITMLVMLSNKQERAEERIKFLESQLGKDTRSFGEKLFDRGFGWLFGGKGK